MFKLLGDMARDFPEYLELPVLHPYWERRPMGMMVGGQGFTPNISERQFYESSVLGYISKYDDIIKARTGQTGSSEDVIWTKTAAMGSVGSAWYSCFRYAGQPPTIAPSNINTGSVMNMASAGALKFTEPGAGQGKYLLTTGAHVSAAGFTIMMLVDLLWAGANVTTNVGTGAQAVNSGALTRYTNGTLVMMTCCVTTQLGATPANITISYKNQGNAATHTSGAIALTTAGKVNQLQPIMAYSPAIVLDKADYGVYQVISATVSALMGAGVMDIYLYKPLAIIPTAAAFVHNENSPGMNLNSLVQLAYGSDNHLGCLGFFAWTGSATTCTSNAFLRTIIG